MIKEVKRDLAELVGKTTTRIEEIKNEMDQLEVEIENKVDEFVKEVEEKRRQGEQSTCSILDSLVAKHNLLDKKHRALWAEQSDLEYLIKKMGVTRE